MSKPFTSREETLDWVEEKANAFWETAGGSGVFTAKFERQQHCYATQIKVGVGKTKRIAIHCTGAKNMREIRPQIEVPWEIVHAWNEMGVDYEGNNDDNFRARPIGGGRPEGFSWCLYPMGEERIRVWARKIGEAAKCLESGKIPMGANI